VPAAVVLAGGGPEPALAPGLPSKAFLEIGGRPLVRRVVDALRGCAAVERIMVVGPAEPLADAVGADAEVVPEQASLMDNLAAGVERVNGRGQVLAVASDLPLITAESISSFLGRCNDGADF
jgi:molybdopterin-guanine dinucleotide biosynthesis protein A